jgi:phosphatidylinositol alpha-mannosyltransferase
MRIGIVTEYCRPWPGGISEHVHHEAQELRARGHHVRILSGPATPEWKDEDDVLRLGFEYKFTSNGALSRFVLGTDLLRFRSLLRRERFDVLHVHAPLDPFLAWAALLASESANVGTFHANFDPGSPWNLLFKTLRPITGRVFDRLHGRIAVSDEARRSIQHYFPGEYEIIPNGVDTARFHPEVAPLPEQADGRPRILFVGRADPRKGLPLLLQAFGQLRQEIEGAELVVVGVEREQVAEQLAELDAESVAAVRFAGYVSPEVLPRYFASSTIFCSPAIGQESQGIVLLEAMAAGRPPVAFAIPGYRDVVSHDADGWLVEQVGAQPLAKGLAEILRDEKRLARLAETGRLTALGYAWPSVAERIEAQLERALRSSGARDSRG